MVGYARGSDISSSSVVADTVSGNNWVGGLVGAGPGADITTSSVVADTVSGDDYVGGLVGSGSGADISYSSVVVDTVSGDDFVGGLVGLGRNADITSSLVLGGSIDGTSHVGGIVGASGRFALPGSILPDHTDHSPRSVENTYRLNGVQFTNAQPLSSNTFGERKSTLDLQAPVSFSGTGNIYANWANAWCDSATGEFTTDSTDALATNANRVWDLGTDKQYPTLTCFWG